MSFEDDEQAVVVKYDYEPSAKQAVAHNIHVDELLYGGAAGGGKAGGDEQKQF